MKCTRNKSFVSEFDARRVAIVFALLSLLLTGCSLGKEFGGENAEKLPELRRIAAETPVFPGFTEVGSRHMGKRENAGLTYFYQSSVSYEEVKGFYTRELGAKGWGDPKEEVVPKWFINDGSKALTFRKGEYTIEVEYDAAGGSRSFSVDFGWEMK